MRRTAEDVITIGQARRLVAATLLARDPAAVPFNRRSLYAAALSWADGDTAWADANCGVGVEPLAPADAAARTEQWEFVRDEAPARSRPI